MPLPPLLIFDMDGVLVDVRTSYRAATAQTVQRYLGDCLGISPPPGLVMQAAIEACKMMSGFNNDWDVTAGLIGFFLAHLPPLPAPSAPPANLDAILTLLAQTPCPADAGARLAEAVDRLPTLIEPVRRAGGGLHNLRQAIGDRNQHLVFYDGEPTTTSLVLRLFQETYLGPALFAQTCHAQPRFWRTPGLIETETLLVKLETLAGLARRHRLAIATGRPLAEAAYTIQRLGLTPFFEAFITHDDVAAAEEAAAAAGQSVRLSKPSPWPLLSAASRLDPGGALAAAYLGDMPDDMMACQRARAQRPFLAIGVTAAGGEALARHLRTAGADFTVRSVDDL